jgi:peptidoglycan/xylan/chitin deacetylase (PgdA/CDA1 family)
LETEVSNLWDQNTPQKFWLCEAPISEAEWREAIRGAAPSLGLDLPSTELNDLLHLSLGEGRFGPDHWSLSTLVRFYYLLKPVLPRDLIRSLRQFYNGGRHEKSGAFWPTDPRFTSFQWEVLRQLLVIRGANSIVYRSLWPESCQFALVLTHDVETARGQALVRELADLEESLGFRSCFNFALRQYPLDLPLMHELRQRGFEVGCHGLRHDGRLFTSEQQFKASAAFINEKMREYGMVGFRSPLTLRHPEWMQYLEIEYDSSFFDTDPFEPIPGGVMSIWPFFLGRFVELPYTLVQDFALAAILSEQSPRIWLQKMDFIRANRGMALVNTHPDYMDPHGTRRLYSEFLAAVRQVSGYWHALPRDAAAWWRRRADASQPAATDTFALPGPISPVAPA